MGMLFVSRSCQFGEGDANAECATIVCETNMSAGEHKSDPRAILPADGGLGI